MKKTWLALTVLLTVGLLTEKVTAQYVAIPDSNFVAWLQGEYPSCMNGNQLDTTCAEVVNATSIYCTASDINDITGIRFFDSLLFLSCANNNLTMLPVLPNTLTTLVCSNNNLTMLPVLPDSLTSLNCSFNEFTTLQNLPPRLASLNCTYNQITILPSLPDSLTQLSCYVNELTTLPALPPFLTTLSCQGNDITVLPPLPSTLAVLVCYGNDLTVLPELPSGLTHLDCYGNQLTSLPELPNGLDVLDCHQNQLSVLPTIPPTLNKLFCGQNDLTAIPELPETLSFFECAHNQITELPSLPDTLNMFIVAHNPQLMCMPTLKVCNCQPSSFYVNNTGINCFPNKIKNLHPSLDTLPICTIYNSNNCEVGWNILGTVVKDDNSECAGNGAPGVNSVKVSLSQDGTFQEFVYPNAPGYFSFDTQMGNYTVSIDTTDLPFNITCPTNNLYSISLTSTDSLDYWSDFTVQCKPGYDIIAQNIVRSSGVFFPNQQANVSISSGDAAQYFGTTCNTTNLSGTVIAIVNGPIEIANTSANGLVSGNTITWNVNDFSLVNFNDDFSVTLVTDTTAQAGDQICFVVSVTANTGTDNNLSNNTLTHCFNVVNSYDPNVKEVYPASYSQPGGWHTYTIHFQNTGTAAAQHILVKDTLDSNLDWNSFQRLGASHNNLTQVKENGIVHFNFLNINLPDSNSNEPASHGYVQYKIKSKSDIAPGTTIHNTAAIYFDFNDPVITNDALVEYEINTGLAAPSTFDFQLFPNPASNTVSIALPKNMNETDIAIADLAGRRLMIQRLGGNQTQLTLEHLTTGTYFVELIVEEKTVAVKKLSVVR